MENQMGKHMDNNVESQGCKDMCIEGFRVKFGDVGMEWNKEWKRNGRFYMGFGL